MDACPVKTLLEVVESVVSCGITVQVSFPHKCDQLSKCRALNVEVMVVSTDISSFLYLHVSDVFHGVLIVGVGRQLGHPELLSFLGLHRQWVRPYLVLKPPLIYLAWTSIVLMFDFLELRLCARLWLALEWAFAFPRIGTMSFIFCLGPSLSTVIIIQVIIIY